MTIFCHLSFWSAVVILTQLGTAQAIKQECTFTRTSGFCAGMTGRFILPEHNTNIHALYIVNCDLTALTSHDFARFRSLSTLHINNCTLPRTTGRSLLADLKALKDLQISHSNLADDIKYMFANNTGLHNLSLQGNRITLIRNDTFSHFTQLEKIDVSNNDISEVDPDAFVNLIHLQELVLSKNKIGQNFDPQSRSQSSGQCGVCGRKCPVDATSSCKGNEAADQLWRAFKEHKGVLSLADNPICSKVDTDSCETLTEAPTEPPSGECVRLQGGACKELEARCTFFHAVCSPRGDDPSSAPEVGDAEEGGGAPESASEVDEGGDPPAPESSVEAGEGAVEGGGDGAEEEPSAATDRDTQGDDDDDYDDEEEDDNVADGVDGAADGVDDGLPASSVEVEEVPVEGHTQLSSHSVLMGAIGGVVAAPMVGGALLVFFGAKRSYRSIDQVDPGSIELGVKESHELETFIKRIDTTYDTNAIERAGVGAEHDFVQAVSHSSLTEEK